MKTVETPKVEFKTISSPKMQNMTKLSPLAPLQKLAPGIQQIKSHSLLEKILKKKSNPGENYPIEI